MVIKICKICGKEFEAQRRALTCSPECSKINEKNNKREYAANHRYEVHEYQKEWYKNNRDVIREQHKEYNKNHRDEIREYQKEWYTNNRDTIREQQKEYQKEYIQNKIAELNKRYDGDLELILKDCPTGWLVREAIMQVEYGKSYSEAMYQKMKANPVCEITGRSDNLVIHHLDSFSLCPEKGADLDNLIRVTEEVHKAFHSQFGYGNNTRDQWEMFIKGYGD